LPIHRFLYLIPLTSKFVSEVLTWSYKSGGLSDVPPKSCSGVPVNKIPGTVTPRASPPSSSTVSFSPSSSVFFGWFDWCRGSQVLGSAAELLPFFAGCFWAFVSFCWLFFFFSSVWPLPLLFAA
jgi:hypothetical protein